MADYEVTGPDGKTYEVTAPDGASQHDVLNYVQQQHAAAPAAPVLQTGPQPTIAQTAVASPLGRFAHDAIVAPLTAGAQLLSKFDPTGLGESLSTMAGNDFVSKPYNNAVAAQQNRPGYADARQKADAVLAARGGSWFTDQPIAPLTSAMAGLTGLPGGLNQMNANADAQTASQEAYQQKHPILSTGGQMLGGLMAMPEGMAPSLATEAKAPLPPVEKPAVPSQAELKSAANAEYKKVDNSGIVLSGNSYDKMVSDLHTKLDKLGIDPDLHPDATAAFNRLNQLKGNGDIPLTKMNTLRELAGDAAGAVLPRDAMRGEAIQDHIDDFVNGLSPEDLTGNVKDPTQTIESLNKARDLWSRYKQSQTIQTVLDDAGIKSGTYTQSGNENAIRAGFRQLALNKRKMAMLNPDLQDAVKSVAKGGPVANALRLAGKFAPHGVVSAGSGAALGFLAGGPAGAIALPVAGEAARFGAAALTRSAAQKALETAALGHAPQASVPVLRRPLMPKPAQLPYGLIGSGLQLQRQ